ncbi:MAG: ureidoglycolate lyase, partial [Candidatus Poriferisodalaceae bacterium]
MKLVAEPITAAAFKPFGDVITVPETYGRRTFTDALGNDDRPFVLSTTHTKSSELPLTVDRLERHPHSSQTFLPLDVQRWLV